MHVINVYEPNYYYRYLKEKHCDKWTCEVTTSSSKLEHLTAKKIALERLISDPSLSAMEKLLIKMCYAQLSGKEGLTSIVLYHDETELLIDTLAERIVEVEDERKEHSGSYGCSWWRRFRVYDQQN